MKDLQELNPLRMQKCSGDKKINHFKYYQAMCWSNVGLTVEHFESNLKKNDFLRSDTELGYPLGYCGLPLEQKSWAHTKTGTSQPALMLAESVKAQLSRDSKQHQSEGSIVECSFQNIQPTCGQHCHRQK